MFSSRWWPFVLARQWTNLEAHETLELCSLLCSSATANSLLVSSRLVSCRAEHRDQTARQSVFTVRERWFASQPIDVVKFKFKWYATLGSAVLCCATAVMICYDTAAKSVKSTTRRHAVREHKSHRRQVKRTRGEFERKENRGDHQKATCARRANNYTERALHHSHCSESVAIAIIVCRVSKQVHSTRYTFTRLKHCTCDTSFTFQKGI